MKLAILFPGIGYHTDKPLLYYSKKILKNMDYEIKEIHFENLDFDLNKSKDEAYKQAKDQIHKFDLKAYDSILFISKLLFCKWVVIIRLFTMFRAHCIPISHFFWR